MAKIFVDTNVLVYALDQADKEKQRVCRAILADLEGAEADQAVISTQIMQEFYVVATRKLGVEPLKAKGILQAFEHFEVVPVSTALIYEAVDCSLLNQISFWDALVVACALSSGCSLLLSEDLHDGQIIQGIRVRDPFLWKSERDGV